MNDQTAEADFIPRQKIVTSLGVVDNTDSSLPSNPGFNSFLAGLAPQLTDSYLVTRVVQYRDGEFSA